MCYTALWKIILHEETPCLNKVHSFIQLNDAAFKTKRIKKQCEFKHLMTIVFNVLSLFYDIEDSPFLLKRL